MVLVPCACSPPPEGQEQYDRGNACGPELSLAEKVRQSRLIIEAPYPRFNCTMFCSGSLTRFDVLWADVPPVQQIHMAYKSGTMPVEIDTVEAGKKCELLRYVMFLSLFEEDSLGTSHPDSVTFGPVGGGYGCAYNGFAIATAELRGRVDSLIAVVKDTAGVRD
jgi:hypothetical protein